MEKSTRPQEQLAKENRSGSFVDNMKLPIHRWFRYSAGFSAEWVQNMILEHKTENSYQVLDPFVGSGTTLLVADQLGVSSIGVEAHPFVARIGQAKLQWASPARAFHDKVIQIVDTAMSCSAASVPTVPKLMTDCYSDPVIRKLYRLRDAYLHWQDDTPASELAWLAITAILRSTSKAGTAQWQYILPNKEKKVVTEPYEALQAQVHRMMDDMNEFQQHQPASRAQLISNDARQLTTIPSGCIDLVITSPPYANNYDYADATRLEMTFWGEVESWGDLHDVVRNKLIVSSSQHAAKEKLQLEELLQRQELDAIRQELSLVCATLARERFQHGGKKQYHTMVAAYFSDVSKVFRELRRVCKPGSILCLMIGDSAPYGVYLPVDQWLGQLALSWGFRSYRFEKVRDRNIKWKNRKHQVPLNEGRLWIAG